MKNLSIAYDKNVCSSTALSPILILTILQICRRIFYITFNRQTSLLRWPSLLLWSYDIHKFNTATIPRYWKLAGCVLLLITIEFAVDRI